MNSILNFNSRFTQSIGEYFRKTFKYITVTIPAKYPGYLPVRSSRKVRTISLAFCAEIGTFHLSKASANGPDKRGQQLSFMYHSAQGHTK